MKKFYILTVLISVIMLATAFAQEKFSEKGNAKDQSYLEKDGFESKTNKDYLLEKKQQTTTTEGESYLVSVIDYDFNSENDSVLVEKMNTNMIAMETGLYFSMPGTAAMRCG